MIYSKETKSHPIRDNPGSVFEVLSAVYSRGVVQTRKGLSQSIAGAVTIDEAMYLAGIVQTHKLTRTLETGVAKGLSTLALAYAVNLNGGHHIGIDPCQRSEHDEAALMLLEEFGLIGSFRLMDGPSHLEAPKLIADSEKFDLIFIDGMHTVDYKIVDVFMADQLLAPGGFLILHDLLLQSVKKTLRFLRTHRDYEMIRTPNLRPTIAKRVRYVAGAIAKRRSYWYFWPNGFSNLLVLRKKHQVAHNWDFYRNF
jgi:predicted O-methyltransferase YrrM